MDTSGDSISSIVVSLLVLAVFIRSGLGMVRHLGRPLTLPWLTIVLVVVIGIPSIGQYVGWPAAGDALRREPQLTLHHGEWWRVITAILAQDGGLIAAIFGLVVVAIAITFSSWLQGSWLTLAIFLVCSVVLNLLALGWNAVGGGTSFASDGVMLSILVWGLVTIRDRVVVSSAILAIAGGVLLVALDDAHGVAILLGAAIGAAHGLVSRAGLSRGRSGPAARGGRGS